MNAHRFIALALGALSVAGFAPVDAFWLPALTLAGLIALWQRSGRPRDGALLGGLFGLGYFGVGVSWIYVSLQQFGGMPAALAAAATALFCAYLALFPALVGAAFVRWRARRPAIDLPLLAALWTLTEWLRGTFLSGFPWLALGYAQTPPSPLAGYAPLIGVYGVSLATVLLAGALAMLIPDRSPAARPERRQAALLIALLLAGGALLRAVSWTEAAGAPVRVALLQGNIEQDLKWRPERFAQSLQTYYELAAAHPATLTVLPETALPAFYDQLPANYLAALGTLARANGGDLLLGAVVGDRHDYRNSAVSLGSAPSQQYAKAHLVPFGEFVPPGFDWFMRTMNIPMSGFTAGGDTQPPLAIAGQQVAVNICYEDVFGAELIHALPTATLLVNVSNTAWFGRSLAQPQHLQIARLRALETGRPMLRATNTGMTAVVEADGTVSAALPPFRRGALVAEVQGRQGMTPFARFGNVPALALAVLLLLPAILAGRRKSR